ncbi:MAG: UDP-N-acetylmuramoyl-L-alanine--D-glutamate ligase [Verrucomicrobiota bacterium]
MADRVAVLGAGISGQAASRLAKASGAEVCVYDENGAGDQTEFSETSIEQNDLFILSPGFAAQHPWRRLITHSKKRFYGELGYAASHWKGRLFAVTGTNGKTTLTQFIAEALKNAGEDVFPVGNIGMPFSDLVLSDANQKDAIAVCEVSSFQAELTHGLALDLLLWSNFAEDHLDRYSSMSEYFAAKVNLLASLKSGASCLLGARVPSWFRKFGIEIPPSAVVVDDDLLPTALGQHSPFSRFPHSKNFQIAAALWGQMDLPVSSLIKTANEFQLAPHRMTLVHQLGNVCFWDDSKATNFHATLAALEATDGPVYWIGGGQGKGGDIQSFVNTAACRISSAYLYGDVGPSLGFFFEKTDIKAEVFRPFSDAVTAACLDALRAGSGNVLLSPGFSSFDQFSSYSERGESFTSLVLGLNESTTAR